ncbi:MAG: hypothetical protein ROY99_14660 [Ignavibacterium sp.]|jgi:hypothetical protein|nr:hypothetical protein [Ignavibacterium sp.]
MNKKKENILITEQDLFNYVFFNNQISDEIKQIIENDNSFAEALEFYSMLKIESVNKPDESLKKKIAEKIPAYSLPNIIYLYQLKAPEIKQNGNKFAADSKELKPKMTTKTFVDNDKEYLIKVLNYGDLTKVFVFSTKDDVVKNFDIVIEPNNIIYHFDDNSEPLKIDKVIEAEKIEIRFI